MKLSSLFFISLFLSSGFALASNRQIAYVDANAIDLGECGGTLTLTNNQGYLQLDLERVQNCTQFDVLVDGNYNNGYVDHPMIEDYNGYSKSLLTHIELGANNIQIIVHSQYDSAVRDIVTVVGSLPPNPGVPTYPAQPQPFPGTLPGDDGSAQVIQLNTEVGFLAPREGGCGGWVQVTRDYNTIYLEFIGVRECSRVDVVSENNPEASGRSNLAIEGVSGDRSSTLEVPLLRKDFHHAPGAPFEITVRSESGKHQDKLLVYLPSES
jgi:hypothetical protein